MVLKRKTLEDWRTRYKLSFSGQYPIADEDYEKVRVDFCIEAGLFAKGEVSVHTFFMAKLNDD